MVRPRSNSWNDFQKANRKKFQSRTEASKVYKRCHSVDIGELLFTQDSISPKFQDQRDVKGLADEIRLNKLNPKTDVPYIRILKDPKTGELKSLSNRRLKAFKDAGLGRVRAIWENMEEQAIREEFDKKNTTKNGGREIRVRTGKAAPKTTAYVNEKGERVHKTTQDLGNGDESVHMHKEKATSAITKDQTTVDNHSAIGAKFGRGVGFARKGGALVDEVTQGPVRWNKSTEAVEFLAGSKTHHEPNPHAREELAKVFNDKVKLSALLEKMTTQGYMDKGIKELRQLAMDGSMAVASKAFHRVLLANDVDPQMASVMSSALKAVCRAGSPGGSPLTLKEQIDLKKLASHPSKAAVPLLNQVLRCAGLKPILEAPCDTSGGVPSADVRRGHTQWNDTTKTTTPDGQVSGSRSFEGHALDLRLAVPKYGDAVRVFAGEGDFKQGTAHRGHDGSTTTSSTLVKGTTEITDLFGSEVYRRRRGHMVDQHTYMAADGRSGSSHSFQGQAEEISIKPPSATETGATPAGVEWSTRQGVFTKETVQKTYTGSLTGRSRTDVEVATGERQVLRVGGQPLVANEKLRSFHHSRTVEDDVLGVTYRSQRTNFQSSGSRTSGLAEKRDEGILLETVTKGQATRSAATGETVLEEGAQRTTQLSENGKEIVRGGVRRAGLQAGAERLRNERRLDVSNAELCDGLGRVGKAYVQGMAETAAVKLADKVTGNMARKVYRGITLAHEVQAVAEKSGADRAMAAAQMATAGTTGWMLEASEGYIGFRSPFGSRFGVGTTYQEAAPVEQSDGSVLHQEAAKTGLHATATALRGVVGLNIVAGQSVRQEQCVHQGDEGNGLESFKTTTLNGVDAHVDVLGKSVIDLSTGYRYNEEGSVRTRTLGSVSTLRERCEQSDTHGQWCALGWDVTNPNHLSRRHTGVAATDIAGVTIRTDAYVHHTDLETGTHNATKTTTSTLMESTECGNAELFVPEQDVMNMPQMCGDVQHELKVGAATLRMRSDDAARLRQAAAQHSRGRILLAAGGGHDELARDVRQVLREANIEQDFLDWAFNRRSDQEAQEHFAAELAKVVHEMEADGFGQRMFEHISQELGTVDAQQWQTTENQQKLLEGMQVPEDLARDAASRGIEAPYKQLAKDAQREVGHGLLHAEEHSGDLATEGSDHWRTRLVMGTHEHTSLDNYDLAEHSICVGRSVDVTVGRELRSSGGAFTWERSHRQRTDTSKIEVEGLIRSINVLGQARNDLSTGTFVETRQIDMQTFERRNLMGKEKAVHFEEKTQGHLQNGQRQGDFVSRSTATQDEFQSCAGLDYRSVSTKLSEGGIVRQVEEGLFVKTVREGEGNFNEASEEVEFRVAKSSSSLSSHSCQGVAGAVGGALRAYLQTGKVDVQMGKEALKSGAHGLVMSVVTQSAERRMQGGGSIAFAAVGIGMSTISNLRNKDLSWAECCKNIAEDTSKALMVMGAVKLASKNMMASVGSIVVPIVDMAFETKRSIQLYLKGEITWARLESNLVKCGTVCVASGGSAYVGAAVGSCIGGPLGAAIGMVVGGVLGGWFAGKLNNNLKKIGDMLDWQWLRKLGELPEEERLERAYAFLGLHGGASPEALRHKRGSYDHISDEEISHLFKKAKVKLHPDKVTDPQLKLEREAKFKELQVYMELIVEAREQAKKNKTYCDYGLSMETIEKELRMTDGQAKTDAEGMYVEPLRALLAYLADYHNEVQFGGLHELDAELQGLLKDKAANFLSVRESASAPEMMRSLSMCLLWTQGRRDDDAARMVQRAYKFLSGEQKRRDARDQMHLDVTSHIVQGCNFGADEVANQTDPKPMLVEARVRASSALRQRQRELDDLASEAHMWKQTVGAAYPQQAREQVFQEVPEVLWKALPRELPANLDVGTVKHLLESCVKELGCAAAYAKLKVIARAPSDDGKWCLALAAATDACRLHKLLRQIVLTPIHAAAAATGCCTPGSMALLSRLCDEAGERICGITPDEAGFSYEGVEASRAGPVVTRSTVSPRARSVPSVKDNSRARQEYDAQAIDWNLLDMRSAFERSACRLGVHAIEQVAEGMLIVSRMHRLCTLFFKAEFLQWSCVASHKAADNLTIADACFRTATACAKAMACAEQGTHSKDVAALLPALRQSVSTAHEHRNHLDVASPVTPVLDMVTISGEITGVLRRWHRRASEGIVAAVDCGAVGTVLAELILAVGAKDWGVTVASQEQWLLEVLAAYSPTKLLDLLRQHLLTPVYAVVASLHPSSLEAVGRRLDAWAAQVCGVGKDAFYGSSAVSSSFLRDRSADACRAGADLKVGDRVWRKGDPATVLKVDCSLEPPGLVVQMEGTREEVNTEFNIIQRVPPDAHAEYKASALEALTGWLLWAINALLRVHGTEFRFAEELPSYGREPPLSDITVPFAALRCKLEKAMLWGAMQAPHAASGGGQPLPQMDVARHAGELLRACQSGWAALESGAAADAVLEHLQALLPSLTEHLQALLHAPPLALPSPADSEAMWADVERHLQDAAVDHWASLIRGAREIAGGKSVVLRLQPDVALPDIGLSLSAHSLLASTASAADPKRIMVRLAALIDGSRLCHLIQHHFLMPLYIRVSALLPDQKERLCFARLCDEYAAQACIPAHSFAVLESSVDVDLSSAWAQEYGCRLLATTWALETEVATGVLRVVHGPDALVYGGRSFYTQAFLMLHPGAPEEMCTPSSLGSRSIAVGDSGDADALREVAFITLQLAQSIVLSALPQDGRISHSQLRGHLTNILRFSTSPFAGAPEEFVFRPSGDLMERLSDNLLQLAVWRDVLHLSKGSFPENFASWGAICADILGEALPSDTLLRASHVQDWSGLRWQVALAATIDPHKLHELLCAKVFTPLHFIATGGEEVCPRFNAVLDNIAAYVTGLSHSEMKFSYQGLQSQELTGSSGAAGGRSQRPDVVRGNQENVRTYRRDAQCFCDDEIFGLASWLAELVEVDPDSDAEVAADPAKATTSSSSEGPTPLPAVPAPATTIGSTSGGPPEEAGRPGGLCTVPVSGRRRRRRRHPRQQAAAASAAGAGPSGSRTASGATSQRRLQLRWVVKNTVPSQ